METPNLPAIRALRPAWNKGRIVGQKRPLKPKHVWAIRVRLELAENHRDLALFNLAIDSKLRGCDLVKMKVVDVMASGQIKERASVLQSKTQKPVRFEISEGTRASGALTAAGPQAPKVKAKFSGINVRENSAAQDCQSVPNMMKGSGHHTVCVR